MSNDNSHKFQPRPPAITAIVVAMVSISFVLLSHVGVLRVGGVIRHPHHTTTTVDASGTSTPRNQVLVQVANGTKKLGLARFETQQLAAQGWNMLTGINGPRVGRTTIYYKPNYADAAATIQKFLGSGSLLSWTGPSPVPGSGVCHILVVVGPDLAN